VVTGGSIPFLKSFLAVNNVLAAIFSWEWSAVDVELSRAVVYLLSLSSTGQPAAPSVHLASVPRLDSAIMFHPSYRNRRS
jgi:hypothetical protein